MKYFFSLGPMSAVLLMALNDHVLKYQFHNFWTGKISDFAGVYFLPFFICAIYELISRKTVKMSTMLLSVVLTDFIFVGVELWSPMTETYLNFQAAIGYTSRVTRDSWDLLALVMNVVTWIHFNHLRRKIEQVYSPSSKHDQIHSSLLKRSSP